MVTSSSRATWPTRGTIPPSTSGLNQPRHDRLLSPADLEAARRFKQLFSAYRRARDLIAVGAYVRGSDPVLDRAIALYPQLSAFLQQDMLDRSSVADGRQRLHQLLAE